jgi:integrase
MAKKAKELSAIEIKRISAPGRHNVGGVVGLYMAVQDTGGKSWIFRYQLSDKRRCIGLGGYPSVTLAQAYDKARELRELVSKGIDPIEQQRQAKAAILAEQAARKTISFREAAIQCHAKMSVKFKNLKHSAQWINTLTTYAFPVIGDLDVSLIDTSHIQKILDPIWTAKTETATRVRQRLEAVLAWSKVSGYRTGDNPARWSGHLDKIYAAAADIKKLKGDTHHAAMPYADVPAFVAYLRQLQSISARALEFTILTGARSGEVTGAVWSEIDIPGKVWVIQAERMKAGREHRVPLSDAAIDILKGLLRFLHNDYVFPSIQKKGPLTAAGLQKPLKRHNAELTVHGFRSAFRDWISEETDCQNIVAEMALAHTIKNAVEAAYRRGDLFEKRVELMQAWSEYCGSHVAGHVIQLSK